MIRFAYLAWHKQTLCNMDYLVKVNPKREREFLEIMRAWEKVGLVESIESHDGGTPETSDSLAMPHSTSFKREKTQSYQIQETQSHYRDLVD